MGFVEIFDDGERFEQGGSVAIHQRRYRHHRIDRAKFGLALLALHEIDVDDLVGSKTLKGERNPHAIGGERTPKRIKLHSESSSFLVILIVLSVSRNFPNQQMILTLRFSCPC